MISYNLTQWQCFFLQTYDPVHIQNLCVEPCKTLLLFLSPSFGVAHIQSSWVGFPWKMFPPAPIRPVFRLYNKYCLLLQVCMHFCFNQKLVSSPACKETDRRAHKLAQGRGPRCTFMTASQASSDGRALRSRQPRLRLFLQGWAVKLSSGHHCGVFPDVSIIYYWMLQVPFVPPAWAVLRLCIEPNVMFEW